MTTLEVAHQLGFVWVARLYNDEITTLDPPDDTKNHTGISIIPTSSTMPRFLPDEHIFPAFDSPAFADYYWDRGILMNRQGFGDTPSEGFISPYRSEQVDRSNQTSGVDPNTLASFTFFDIPPDDVEAEEEEEQENPTHVHTRTPTLFVLDPHKLDRSIVRHNALIVTQVCINMGLSETSPILQDQAVQDALFDLVQRTHVGEETTTFHTPIPLSHIDLAYPLIRQILLDSTYLNQRTLDHLHSLSEPGWKTSLAFSNSNQRHLLCESMLLPRGLETGFIDPVMKYYQVWSTHIQTYLDRLDLILEDIYGPSSVRPVISRLREEQARNVYGRQGAGGGGGAGRGPLLIRLVEVCRMWNDTIASCKIQKMLFSEGLETCE